MSPKVLTWHSNQSPDLAENIPSTSWRATVTAPPWRSHHAVFHLLTPICSTLQSRHTLVRKKKSWPVLGFRKALGSLNLGEGRRVNGLQSVLLLKKNRQSSIVSFRGGMGCAVRLTPPCITSWFVCSLQTLVITCSISTSLISHGTVAFEAVLKSSSDTVTAFLSHVFGRQHSVSLQHRVKKQSRKISVY